MCVVVRMARIAGKENLFEVATCRLLNFGSPDFSNATTFPPQEKDDCNRKAEGSYQAPRTGIESSPRGRRRPHTPRGGEGRPERPRVKNTSTWVGLQHSQEKKRGCVQV